MSVYLYTGVRVPISEREKKSETHDRLISFVIMWEPLSLKKRFYFLCPRKFKSGWEKNHPRFRDGTSFCGRVVAFE